VGAAFTSTVSQHGGQESTLLSILTNLLHQGLISSGLPYSFQGQLKLDEVTGGDGSPAVSANELDGARFLGNHVATIAARLFA